ncbi:MAG: hypothetical protein ACYTBJ_25550 [Planctomycetota bacterium]
MFDNERAKGMFLLCGQQRRLVDFEQVLFYSGIKSDGSPPPGRKGLSAPAIRAKKVLTLPTLYHCGLSAGGNSG